jgi:tryptophan aminotransferase
LTAWGYEGFFTHTRTVSQFYQDKRDAFEKVLHKHLEGLIEWSSPQAGMFIWYYFPDSRSISSLLITDITPRFKLLLKPNGTDDTDDGDSESIIRKNALEKGVLALPGTVFLPNGRKTAYVRASFSLLSEDDAEEAVRRLKEVILDARKDLQRAS